MAVTDSIARRRETWLSNMLFMDKFLGAVSKDFDEADEDQNGKMSFEEFLGTMQAK